MVLTGQRERAVAAGLCACRFERLKCLYEVRPFDASCLSGRRRAWDAPRQKPAGAEACRYIGEVGVSEFHPRNSWLRGLELFFVGQKGIYSTAVTRIELFVRRLLIPVRPFVVQIESFRLSSFPPLH